MHALLSLDPLFPPYHMILFDPNIDIIDRFGATF